MMLRSRPNKTNQSISLMAETMQGVHSCNWFGVTSSCHPDVPAPHESTLDPINESSRTMRAEADFSTGPTGPTDPLGCRISSRSSSLLVNLADVQFTAAAKRSKLTVPSPSAITTMQKDGSPEAEKTVHATVLQTATSPGQSELRHRALSAPRSLSMAATAQTPRSRPAQPLRANFNASVTEKAASWCSCSNGAPLLMCPSNAKSIQASNAA
mmetsp:Transcript_5845/g.13430  ORF Transcript_5845/g.13430 Transcript_5845/m.13430 type:complete len:212 (-) Transcript_5845:60-695(-)